MFAQYLHHQQALNSKPINSTCCLIHGIRRDLLISTSDPVPALAGKVVSGGRVNLARALAKLLAVDVPAAPPPTECKWERGSGLCQGRPGLSS